MNCSPPYLILSIFAKQVGAIEEEGVIVSAVLNSKRRVDVVSNFLSKI